MQLALTEQGRDTTRQAVKVVQGLLEQLLAPFGGLDSERTQDFKHDLVTLLDAPLDPLAVTGEPDKEHS